MDAERASVLRHLGQLAGTLEALLGGCLLAELLGMCSKVAREPILLVFLTLFEKSRSF